MQDSVSIGRESLDALLGNLTKSDRTAANGCCELKTSGLDSQFQLICEIRLHVRDETTVRAQKP
jgi:hypothetical protein